MKIPEKWNAISYRRFLRHLITFQDETYKRFNFKLIFTNYKKIGIRMPLLKDIAKKIAKEDIFSFLEVVGDTYYEEVLLEGLVIAKIKDVEQSLFYFEKYIEKIDNWALCDYVVGDMKIVKENKDIYFKRIKKYVKSYDEYRVRVGLVLLLDYYIEKQYLDKTGFVCHDGNREKRVAVIIKRCNPGMKPVVFFAIDGDNGIFGLGHCQDFGGQYLPDLVT